MKTLKGIKDFLLQNLSNVFSFIGIILTIYFAVFYVPSYVYEIKYDKNYKINSELIDNIQELVYFKLDVNIHDIETLICGKSLKYNISYNYSVDDLLIQVQEDFMENKLIPLSDRKEVIEKIDKLRSEIEPDIEEKSSNYSETWTSIISILAGIISGCLGMISLVFKIRKEKENIVTDEAINIATNASEKVIRAVEYERMVVNTFNSLNIYPKNIMKYNDKFDFCFKSNGKNVFVEIKYCNEGVTSSRIMSYLLRKIEGVLIEDNDIYVFVLNKNLSTTANEILNNYIKNSKTQIKVVVSDNTDDLKEKLIEIIKI